MKNLFCGLIKYIDAERGIAIVETKYGRFVATTVQLDRAPIKWVSGPCDIDVKVQFSDLEDIVSLTMPSRKSSTSEKSVAAKHRSMWKVV